jgi:hypothetical protein
MVVPFALVAVPAMGAATVWTCDNTSNVREIDLPVGVPSPGGKTATAIYIDDRPDPNGGNALPNAPDGKSIPGDGFVEGPEGTWIYLETDGLAGLQRGGISSLPTTPLTGANDFEICQGGCATWGANQIARGGCTIHDELIF